MAKQDSSFVLRRVHSLLGVIPLGVFLLQHLIVNYQATVSVERFNWAANIMGNLPFVYFLEIFVIYIPILFHGIYGIYIALTAKHNVGRYSTFRNWMFLIQRISGIIAFVFIAVHVWQTRIQVFFGAEVNFDMVADVVTNPFWFAFWFVGIIATVFHFANGIWSFAITWGITQSARAQQFVAYVALAIFVAVSYIGISALFAFI